MNLMYGFLGVTLEGLATPEVVVAWLLEHPEITVSDTESLSSYYSSEDESCSEQPDVVLQGYGDCVSCISR